MVFSMMSGISLIFQPIFGIISDHLVITIAAAMILIGPYFQRLFNPLLGVNSMFAAIITGIYLSFVLNGGFPSSNNTSNGPTNGFEYGHSRMGGSLAGAVAALVGGRLFLWSPNSIFWACTVAAIILTCCFVFSDNIHWDNVAAAGEDTSNKLDVKQIGSIFKLRNFWILSLFYMGTSAIYDVFDQQFIIFFKSFFHAAAQGTLAYSYITSAQTALEFLLMIPMPWIINKIGSLNGLICYGVILTIRIVGSAMVPSLPFIIIILRLLAGLEMPLLLVFIMKYIAGAFDLRLYTTVYALSSNFAKQISVFFSSFAGKLYDQIGFQHTYLILGIIVGVVTLICAFTLTKEDPVQAGEVKEAKN